jgi:hypothetical protein
MWKAKKIKPKCGIFGERGRRQRGLSRGLLAITLGNSGKNLPSSGVPGFAECSCTGRSAKKFFQKNKKPSLPTAFAPGSRHMIFFKKIEKHLCRRPLPGALGTGFFNKIKTPLFCRRPILEAVGKEDFKKPST